MKKELGITLISLVVTIIVLIILAGVSINLILGKDGIITKTRQAKENMEIAQIEEETALNELYMQIETEGGVSSGNITYEAILKLAEFKKEIASAITDMGVATSENADKYTMATNIRSILDNANASSINYDNKNSGLTSTNVQSAIDELNSDISQTNNNLDKIGDVYQIYINRTEIQNETFTPLTSLTLPEKGTYLIIGKIRYDVNTNGARGISVHGTSGWNSLHNVVNAISSKNHKTIVEHSRIETFSEPTTLYLNAYQNSGSTLACDVAYIQCVKLSTE